MEKGIFYLICSIVIVSVVVGSAAIMTSRVEKICEGHTLVQKEEVMVTPSPTATPEATLRPLIKAVIVTPTK